MPHAVIDSCCTFVCVTGYAANESRTGPGLLLQDALASVSSLPCWNNYSITSSTASMELVIKTAIDINLQGAASLFNVPLPVPQD